MTVLYILTTSFDNKKSIDLTFRYVKLHIRKIPTLSKLPSREMSHAHINNYFFPHPSGFLKMITVGYTVLFRSRRLNFNMVSQLHVDDVGCVKILRISIIETKPESDEESKGDINIS